MKCLLMMWMVIVCLVWPSLAMAKPPTPSKLAVGDKVLVLVPSLDGVKKYDAQLDSSGKIKLPLYGSVMLQGLTPKQAEVRVRKHLSHWLNDTSGVSLVVKVKLLNVLVTGQVTTPKRYSLPQDASLWQAISAAGALLPGADLTRVTIHRAGKTQQVDVSSALSGGQLKATPALKTGDVIMVPAKHGVLDMRTGKVELLNTPALKGKVFVLGAVKAPGLHPWSEKMTPLMAVGLSGGARAEADLHHAIWMTAKTRQIVDISPLHLNQNPPKCSAEMACILYIPSRAKAGQHDKMGRTIKVLGAVKQQGHHQINGSVSLVDAVALAQGATDKADISKVYVTRQGDGFAIVTQHDLGKQLTQGGAAMQMRLQPGQTVYVSPKEASKLSKVAKAVSEVAIIAAAFTLFAAFL